MSAPLNQGYGYGIVVGFGAFFSIFITALWAVEKRYTGFKSTSEEYSTAGRSIKIGLLCSSVVSAWTWAATLLQSSSVAYDYGVSGPYWYAAGATIQILLFAILAIEVKRKAAYAHTFPEVIKARYGTTAHKVFLYFGLMTNMIVTAMLLLGGAAVANSLTGMNIYAACFLIPLGIILYVMIGGLRATFLTDFVHTMALFIIILFFGFVVYVTSPLIGSPKAMTRLLEARSAGDAHVTGNADGSFLTMASQGGIIFGIINIVGNFGTVFCDQAYWQRAFAARPSATVKGYILGGLCWFTIPFFLATTLGLAGVALENTSSFPSQAIDPDTGRMFSNFVSAGLVAPYAAVALCGSSGAVAILILVFLAVTSAASAELIAVSSLLTFDVYREYIKPNATGKELVRVSHYSTVGFGIFMGVLASVLNNFGITLGYLYLLMGIIVAPAVVPIALTLTWSKQNATAAITAAVGGFCGGLTTWLVTAQCIYGNVSLDSTGANYPMLAGNLVSLLLPILITVPMSFYAPQNFDFSATLAIQPIADETEETVNELHNELAKTGTVEEDPNELNKALRIAYIAAWLLTAVLIFIIPLPMLGQRYVFTWQFFTAWVVIGFAWTWFAGLFVTLFPIYESKDGIAEVIQGISNEVFLGKSPEKSHDIAAKIAEVDGDTTHGDTSMKI